MCTRLAARTKVAFLIIEACTDFKINMTTCDGR